MSAPITEAHEKLALHVATILRGDSFIAPAAQLIADGEARALEATALQRDTYQREAYHLRKDLCEIAAAFNVGVPDSDEAKKRIIAVKAERDALRAIHQKHACAGETLDETLSRLRYPADKACEERDALRTEVERLDTDRLDSAVPHAKALVRAEKAEAAQLDAIASCDMAIARAEKAEAELADAKELLREIRDHEVNEADEADKFLRDHIPSELSKARAELAPSEPQAQSARCSVVVGSALRWAVFPCGWKWEIGRMTRENETPVAIFEHKHHAESFCREWWPQLGEVRSWPNIAMSQPGGQS